MLIQWLSAVLRDHPSVGYFAVHLDDGDGERVGRVEVPAEDRDAAALAHVLAKRIAEGHGMSACQSGRVFVRAMGGPGRRARMATLEVDREAAAPSEAEVYRAALGALHDAVGVYKGIISELRADRAAMADSAAKLLAAQAETMTGLGGAVSGSVGLAVGVLDKYGRGSAAGEGGGPDSAIGQALAAGIGQLGETGRAMLILAEERKEREERAKLGKAEVVEAEAEAEVVEAEA